MHPTAMKKNSMIKLSRFYFYSISPYILFFAWIVLYFTYLSSVYLHFGFLGPSVFAALDWSYYFDKGKCETSLLLGLYVT